MTRIQAFVRRHRIITVLMAVLLLLSMLYVYMKWEFHNIRVTNVRLGFDGDIRIVYAADFQYDMKPGDDTAIQSGTFQKSIDMINAQQADVILLGGDYATFSSNWEAAVPYLSQLEAPKGIYAVFGNHDRRSKEQLADALPNIHFLENEAVNIDAGGKAITIYGVEDLWTGEPYIWQRPLTGDYKILLTHNPDYFEQLNDGNNPFDLTLAGHIHAGQVALFGRGIPVVLRSVTRYGQKYRYGDKVYDGRRIYITSGLGGGIMGRPLRLGAWPEIVVLE